MTDFSRITRGIRTGYGTDGQHHSIMPPVYPATNYDFREFQPRTALEYDYSRAGNPTRDMLARALATLEGGARGTITGSGMSAINLVLSTLVPKHGRVLAPHDAYGGTWRLLEYVSSHGAYSVEYVDFNDTEALTDALSREPDLLLLESPSNPLLRTYDIAAIAELAHSHDALLVVDNTFCSPIRQQPISLGADIVVHSLTKFINGHSDVVGGAVITADSDTGDLLDHWSNALGLTASAWDSWLALRGLRTIDARIRVHDANTLAAVDELKRHDVVEKIHFPGLDDHPGHELAAKQQSSFGSMISFELGSEEAARAFANDLEIFIIAESLGGIESLVAHPTTMTHASMTDKARAKAGITPGLLRLSIGIEPVDDLVADLRAGLERAASV